MERRSLIKGAAALLAAPLVPAMAAPAVAQDLRARTLRFIPQTNLSVLDPVWTTATVTSNHGYYVFDTLYSTDSQLRPRPQMAEGHEVSDDRLRWRIRLRPGLLFHDGTPVLARDCVASLKRWCAREPFGQLLAKVVADWVAADDRTIELRLSRPFPLLLDALAKSDASVPFIMPERLALTDPNKAITEMVGSGPYRFVAAEFNSGNQMVYEKFDRYLPRPEAPDWATGGKVAHFSRIEWHVIPDPSTAASALLAGEVDWWERPLADLQPLLAGNKAIVREVSDPSGRLALMRLNCLQPPFDDVRLRRAVMRSVVQETYMRATQGDDTTLWTTCRSLWPRFTPYYGDADADLMPGSLDAARSAMKEAGYAGQRAVIISPTDYPDIGPLGQVTADTLKRAGFAVDMQETDWGTVVQRRTNREPVSRGGWSIFHTTGAASGYANPAVSPLVRGQGDRGWFGWWSNKDAEAMADEWLFAPDPASQTRIARQMGRLAMDEVATIPLGQFFVRTAHRASVTGIVPGPTPYPWGVRPA